jgi:hypothetical protein
MGVGLLMDGGLAARSEGLGASAEGRGALTEVAIGRPTDRRPPRDCPRFADHNLSCHGDLG